MSSSWEQVQRLFDEVRSLPAEEREGFLTQACGTDASLRAELESLLGHHEAATPEFMKLPEPPAWIRRSSSPKKSSSWVSQDETLTCGSTSASELASSPPLALPDYELVRFIGKGGFGQVWLSRQKLTGVFYAVKLIPKNRFGAAELSGIREYKQRAAGHPHLIHLEHVGQTPEWYYYVMELADDARGGGVRDPDGYEPSTLTDRTSRKGPLSVREAIQIACEILDGLEHLHDAGLLHRDVKPANILLRQGQWCLADLGLATSHLKTEVRAGTPAYEPPEGVRDRTGDLYSLGRVLIELTAGRTAESSYTELMAPRNVSSGIARRFATLITRACAKDPGLRFQSAPEMRRAIEPLAVHENHRRTMIAIVLGMVVAAALLVWFQLGPGGRDFKQLSNLNIQNGRTPDESTASLSSLPTGNTPKLVLTAKWLKVGLPGIQNSAPNRLGPSDELNLHAETSLKGFLYVFLVNPKLEVSLEAAVVGSHECISKAYPNPQSFCLTYRLDEPPGRYVFVAVLMETDTPIFCRKFIDELGRRLSRLDSDSAIESVVHEITWPSRVLEWSTLPFVISGS